MYTIKFKNLHLRPGYQTTCRLGDKHFNHLNDYKSKEIYLTDLIENNKIKVKLLSLDCKSFILLSECHISSNHDPFARKSRRNLEKVMKDLYKESFEITKKVTIIGFDFQPV